MSLDAVATGSGTLLDVMSAALPQERQAQVREAVARLGLDPNNPQVVLMALASDLTEVAEGIPDALAQATAQIDERAQSASEQIVHAFEDGIARAKPAASAFVAEEMTTFQVALDRVCADRINFVIKAVKKQLESPWYKYGTIIACVIGGLAFLLAGVYVGRVQGVQMMRTYNTTMALKAPAMTRAYIESYQMQNSTP